MLEFKKRILQKVSFDLEIFEKELNKAAKWMMDDELMELKSWCKNNFSDNHQVIIDKCFQAEKIAS